MLELDLVGRLAGNPTLEDLEGEAFDPVNRGG